MPFDSLGLEQFEKSTRGALANGMDDEDADEKRTSLGAEDGESKCCDEGSGEKASGYFSSSVKWKESPERNTESRARGFLLTLDMVQCDECLLDESGALSIDFSSSSKGSDDRRSSRLSLRLSLEAITRFSWDGEAS